MARFFAVLSGSTPTSLTSDYFDQRTISSGESKRSGLIASRSVLSEDVYEDLDPVNRDGSRGVYFPPDLITTTATATAQAYTSSIAGIVYPSNFRTRPTSSVLSTNPNITDVNDSVSLEFAKYSNASNAVTSVLASIQGGGPYARLGNNRVRTACSIWHDEELRYFGWDDFTPGVPTGVNVTTFNQFVCSGSDAITGSVRAAWGKTYENDINPAGTTKINWTVQNTPYTLTSIGANITSTDIALEFPAQVVPLGKTYPATASVQFFDAVIPTHGGQSASSSVQITIPATTEFNCKNTEMEVDDYEFQVETNVDCLGDPYNRVTRKTTVSFNNNIEESFDVIVRYTFNGYQVVDRKDERVISVPTGLIAGTLVSSSYYAEQYSDVGLPDCVQETLEVDCIVFPQSVFLSETSLEFCPPATTTTTTTAEPTTTTTTTADPSVTTSTTTTTTTDGGLDV